MKNHLRFVTVPLPFENLDTAERRFAFTRRLIAEHVLSPMAVPPVQVVAKPTEVVAGKFAEFSRFAIRYQTCGVKLQSKLGEKVPLVISDSLSSEKAGPQRISDALRDIRSNMVTDEEDLHEELNDIVKLQSSVEELKGKVKTLGKENSILKEEIRAANVLCHQNEQASKALLFGVPGKVDEIRTETGAICRRILANRKTEVKARLICDLRMNRKIESSPIILTFGAIPHAPESFHRIRGTEQLCAADFGLEGDPQIDVRFHLSRHGYLTGESQP